MQKLIRVIKENQEYQSLLDGVRSGLGIQLVTGMTTTLKSLAIQALAQDSQRPICIISHNMGQAQEFYDEILSLGIYEPEAICLYPASDFIMMDYLHTSLDETAGRIQTLERLFDQGAKIIIAPLFAVQKALPPMKDFKEYFRLIKETDELELEEFAAWLSAAGYEREAKTETPGHFSVRGGLIDLFPLTGEEAYRIELFDTEIDSIRTFDPLTQKSTDRVQEIKISPCTEWPLSLSENVELGHKLERAYQKYVGQLEKKATKEKTSSNNKNSLEKNENFGQADKHGDEGTESNKKNKELKIELARELKLFEENFLAKAKLLADGNRLEPEEVLPYVQYLYKDTTCLLDYLPVDTILLIDEPSRIVDKSKSAQKEVAEWQTSMIEGGKLLPKLLADFDPEAIYTSQHTKVLLATLIRKFPGASPSRIISITSQTASEFHGQMPLVKSELDRLQARDYQIYLAGPNQESLNKISRVFGDYDIPLGHLIIGDLTRGFELPSSKLLVLTEADIFGHKVKRKSRISKQANAERIKNYQDLKPGDYVVHLAHGIGRYVGVETLEINGIHRDYVKIAYSKNDSLYVPIDQLQNVQKYIGGDESAPKLNSLNGSAWANTKSRVKSAVKDIADDLIKLYAERKLTPGYAYSPDTEWQREFEGTFPYEDTPDQMRSIREIKKDMEAPYPMDRLLCGDVGYGKTEVAIRAAFKAVLDGKQVGVLVPTTILAQQHYENFKDRFAGYPIKVEVLSRFRSRAEITKSLKRLKEGNIDVIIGTHRLLSKDVAFDNLGLLVVDEEQRFGVSHKEKIKQLKQNIDVLTLTATPIPRTLHMSLLGVRDLSLIETPPPNRFPVETFVMEYNPIFIREVIEREVNRQGQVYFVYNNINTIELLARSLQEMMPDLRIAIGHGRMGEQELERVMLDFMDHEYDILLSTTIIETGLDIPNVNTLIVYNADRMGLSQLYQLRGRVGRSNRVAYAYFTFQKDKVLTEVAEKRLSTIKEFTELGSGFKIAMRDLSIRGAGNLLGAEQHGHIAAVGYDMYNYLLAEAVKELQNQGGEPVEEKVEPEIEIEVSAYLPDSYVADSIQKIEFYKRMARVDDLEAVEEIGDDLLDRFGNLPLEADLLMGVTRLKAYCKLYKITEIKQVKNEIIMKIHESENQIIDGQALLERMIAFEDRIRIQSGQNITIIVKINRLKEKEIMDLLLAWMQAYDGVRKTKEAVNKS